MENYRYSMGRRGMVASAHSLISSTGLNTLRNNGNAMDAAISMALTASVVLPDMCGIGGDTFLLYFDNSTKKVYALNGSGPMGSKYTVDFYKSKGYSVNPEHGALSISVPGTISALMEGLEKFGSKSFKDCAIDAIYYASNGFPVGKKTSEYIEKRIDTIKQSDALSRIFLDENGLPKKVHSTIINKNLASTLELLSNNSKEYFYQNFSDVYIKELNKFGACFTSDDFKKYKAEWLEPIRLNYNDFTVFQVPPVSQGIIHLETLNILSNFGLNKLGSSSSEQIHLMVEAKKIAFDDRIKLFGDPKFNHNPVNELLSKEYGELKSKLINKDKTNDVTSIFEHQDKHTTSMVVVDEYGNACSLITSISDAFGSGVMDDVTGILWNNRIGTNANLVVNHPNCVAPNKKTMNTLNTYIILDRNSNCRFVGNTPGGDNQPQWNTQMVVHLIDNKLTLLDAIHQPLWYDAQSSNPYNKLTENILFIENTIDKSVVDELESKGHKVKLIDRCNCAIQLIEIKEDGILCGATDFRAEGVAIGY